MKKNLFKLLSLLLALCLVLCACGETGSAKDDDEEKETKAESAIDTTAGAATEDPTTEDPTTEDPAIETTLANLADDALIVGTWKTELDFGGVYNLLMAMLLDNEISSYLDFTGLAVPIYYTFEADGTYTMVIEEDDLKAFAENTVTLMLDGMYDMVEALLADELNGKTLEEYLTERNLTFEELLAEMDLDVDTLADTMLEAMEGTTSSGVYEIADGMLTFDGEEQPVELGPDVMVVYAPEGEYDEATQELLDSMYPMEFVRIS